MVIMLCNPTGVRLSALKLAQLSWLDRRWILRRLPVAQREQVSAALSELRLLNIGNQAELLQQLLSIKEVGHPVQESELRLQLSALMGSELNLMTSASKALLARCLQVQLETVD
jgi:hypothetical protein|tara:strand:+ start:12333 stop:12674 length:342 start_codon:yes stop_codon:yes gene_type:complete